MSKQYVWPSTGGCAFCETVATVYRRNLALVMVDPDGSVCGYVCGDCFADGTYLKYAVRAWLECKEADTPTDEAVYGGGDGNS